MAIFRKIHVSFWGDEFIESLTPEQKFFYLYLMTNNRTTQCGIYEITTKQMVFQTGYNEDTIKKLLQFFTDRNKIFYSVDTKEIAIKNWPKYNDSASPKVKTCISKELKIVKNRVCIEYVYSMDTHTQEEEEEEEEEEVSTADFDFKKLDERGKKIYKMFRRNLDRTKFTDAIVISEVNKFQNRYPEVILNSSGALVNAWCTNLQKPATSKQKIHI